MAKPKIETQVESSVESTVVTITKVLLTFDGKFETVTFVTTDGEEVVRDLQHHTARQIVSEVRERTAEIKAGRRPRIAPRRGFEGLVALWCQWRDEGAEVEITDEVDGRGFPRRSFVRVDTPSTAAPEEI